MFFANNGQVKAHSWRELSPKVTEGERGIMESVLFSLTRKSDCHLLYVSFWGEMWRILKICRKIQMETKIKCASSRRVIDGKMRTDVKRFKNLGLA